MEELSKMELKDLENDNNETTSLTPSDPIFLKDYKPLNPQKGKNKYLPIKIAIALFISFFLIITIIFHNEKIKMFLMMNFYI